MENRNYDNNELLNLAVEAAGGTFERSYDNNLCLNRLVVALEAGGGGGSTVDAYTKAESDAKYQEKGDYAEQGDCYTKDESDELYQEKGDYVTNNDINKVNITDEGVSITHNGDDTSIIITDEGVSFNGAEVYFQTSEGGKAYYNGQELATKADISSGSSYTKSESDEKYQEKGDYVNSAEFNALSQEAARTTECDEKYQEKGDYEYAGTCYTKDEADEAFASKSETVTLVGTDESGTEYTFTLYGNQD